MVSKIRQLFIQRKQRINEKRRIERLIGSSNSVGTTSNLFSAKPQRIFTGYLLDEQKKALLREE